MHSEHETISRRYFYTQQRRSSHEKVIERKAGLSPFALRAAEGSVCPRGGAVLWKKGGWRTGSGCGDSLIGLGLLVWLFSDRRTGVKSPATPFLACSPHPPVLVERRLRPTRFGVSLEPVTRTSSGARVDRSCGSINLSLSIGS